MQHIFSVAIIGLLAGVIFYSNQLVAEISIDLDETISDPIMSVESSILDMNGDVSTSDVNQLLVDILNNTTKSNIKLLIPDHGIHCIGNRDEAFDAIQPIADEFIDTEVQAERISLIIDNDHKAVGATYLIQNEDLSVTITLESTSDLIDQITVQKNSSADDLASNQ